MSVTGDNQSSGQNSGTAVGTSRMPANVDQLRAEAKKSFIGHRQKQTVKKYLLGAVGAAAVVMGTNGAAKSNIPPPEPVAKPPVTAPANPPLTTKFAADGTFDATKNH